MTVVFFNGEFLEEREANISATSSAALFGEGVFTTMFVEEGKVADFPQHLARLEKDANFLGLELPKIEPKDINKLISLNNAMRGTFRLRITLFSKEKAELFFRSKNGSSPVNKLKTCDFLINLAPYSSIEKKSYRLCIYPDIVSTPISRIKSLNYLERFVFQKYALEHGFDDALILGPKNKILETSFANIFWIEGQKLFLPHASLPYFRGTTLGLVLTRLSPFYKICEGFFELQDISDNANVYLCSSLKKIASVSQIESRVFETAYLRAL